MSESLYLEIVRTLDYSNSSKDRLQQLIVQREQRVISALANYANQKDLDSSKQYLMFQLKKDLDIILFGKSVVDSNGTVGDSSPLSGNQQFSYQSNFTTGITKSPSTQSYSTKSNQETIGAARAAGSQETSTQYNPIQQNNHDDYLQELASQIDNSRVQVENNQNYQQQANEEISSQSDDGEETVKRGRKIKQLSEYELDQRIQAIRTEKKAKLSSVLKVNSEYIKKEQMRLQEFKRLWRRGQPLTLELYRMFYDAVDDLDFAQFLQMRHELHIDEIGVKELIDRQKSLFKDTVGTAGLNPEQYIKLLDAQNLRDEDIFKCLLIFFYLDFNNNGLLDQDELLLGFVMLANSSEKEKIEAAFSIVDENGSGTLDINEMTKYMRSVIRMGDGRKFNTDDSFEHEFLVEKMAVATAQAIFREMDLDHNERISFEEFVVWHNLHGMDTENFDHEKQKVQAVIIQAQKERNENLMKFNAFTLQNDDYRELTNHRLSLVVNQKLNENGVKSFRKNLSLGEIPFLDAVRYLKEFKVSDRLGFGAFFNFMKELYAKCNVNIDITKAKDRMNEFFNQIDLDSNGFVDWNEILGAFSLLCTGTVNEKIRGVFEVFDINDDNFLQFDEVYALFVSSFNLIFLRNPDSEIARSDPKKLAFSMALSAFSDNQLDPYTNGLDYETFSKWYRNFDTF